MGILEKLGLGWFTKKNQTTRIMIVSNRLPVTVGMTETGPAYSASSGGLATGLGSIYQNFDSVWIGWPGLEREKGGNSLDEIGRTLSSQHAAIPVWLDSGQINGYYHGFSNKTIWPLFHYFPKLTVYNREYWEAYVAVNKLFANAVLNNYIEGDIIWIHDYQLMLAPAMIRERIPDATIGFFLHIPFPTFEVFRLLPWREPILRGLLGADLAGFHTYDYTMYFIRSVRRLLGYESHMFQINLPTRVVRADTFPIGIDFDKYSQAADDKEVLEDAAILSSGLEGVKVILSVDRMDYTKGIPQRMEALDLFFTRYPQWKGRVVNVVVAAPSRDAVDQYQHLKKEVDELVGKINGKHGRIGWQPVQYLYRSMPFKSMAALYRLADIAMITPLRDGMNLVAKEYVAAKNNFDGVLILSEMTGASMELSEALTVNPNNVEGMAEAIAIALEMTAEEKAARMESMRVRVRRYNASAWSGDFMARLSRTRDVQRTMAVRIPSQEERNNIAESFRLAKAGLFLLDYDGSLANYQGNPAKARPDAQLLLLLNKLAGHPGAKVVIISGRDRATLEEWFCEVGVDLVSEHGAAIKRSGEWTMMDHASGSWKGEIRPILDFFADRTPGAFVEEKELSLVWHYRKTDPEFGAARANEVQDTLKALLSNYDLQAQEGVKCIDIHNASINKGMAAKLFLAERDWDFVMAIGDDVTDEDMFRVLPDNSFSIKVGLVPSAARFNLESPVDMIKLLDDIAGRRSE